MRKSIRRTLLGATLALIALEGCDPNPNGPTYSGPPVAEEDDSTQGPGGSKKKARRKGIAGNLIGDPRN